MSKLQSVLDHLKEGADWVEKAAPLVAALGLPGVTGVTTMAGTLSSVIMTIGYGVSGGVIAATTQEKEELDALQARLQAENDALAAQIANS